MVLNNKITGVSYFGFYKNSPVIEYNDYMTISGRKFDTNKQYYHLSNNKVFALFGDRNGEVYVLKENNFVQIHPRFDTCNVLSENLYVSYKLNGNVQDVSVCHNGLESIFSINTNKQLRCEKVHKDGVLLFYEFCKDSMIIFYSTTGERLWEYKTENPDWKINRMCIPMVDDVVVIINNYNLMTVSIEGYNIKTGEKLWMLHDDNNTDIFPCHFIVGDDKMLYACKSHWKNTDRKSKNIELTSINPHNGEFNRHILKEVDQHTVISPWNTCIYGNKLYYADNRPGCVLGVVDLDKKQIVDEFNFNLKKGFTMGAPVVTEDKIYQFIRNKKEVWVFDK